MDLIARFAEAINTRHYRGLKRHVGRIGWLEKIELLSLDLHCWQPPPLPRMRMEVDFGFGGEADVRAMARDSGLDVQRQEALYLEKLRRGDLLYVGKRREEVVFYLWVITGRKDMINHFMLLEEGEFAVERSFTKEECRGHGLYPYGFIALIDEAKGRGLHCCLTDIALHNPPMLNTARRLGFERTDSFYLWLRHPFGQYTFPRGPLAARFIPK
ncbi:GNAT family N-acetyltransferase [Geobacter pickeringii]|uniref:N-acetyltransferase domain-containing protein n=1 Tax=Geobacter pickeringii TaxID=345632 RepID=A0A0B5BHF6_9BACT|nr:hypothetical protein [Geobacter pickeringii]AJE03466.1 hypothetical protein GPICK_08975 [Geobacter pickeringii]